MERLWLYKLTRLVVAVVFHLYFRTEYIGKENVPEEGAMIVAPNHVSYLDPIWVSIPFARPLRYMTWDKMTGLPFLGWLMRAYGAFPVNLESPSGDRTALRQSLKHLRAGGGLMIFPEGARTRDGRLMAFKPGVIRLAFDTGVPIVPVTIVGGYEAYSPHHFFPRPYKLKVIYHEPIKLGHPPEDMQMKDYLRGEAERLRQIVASALPQEAVPL
ncbi:MAG: 1-acyl-sn-glycerol-3-phosphate acyltransferase, partial [Blastocatellia bacterium]|nr:1-acyl-sn-glycerol-3-phosphate acyltransferase [Blastocatellia bacterium]